MIVLRFSPGDMMRKMIVLFLIILIITGTGCTGSPKYTYEEYKKIKAINRSDSPEGENMPEEDLSSYYDDLEDYNLYMNDFRAIYDKYSGLMVPEIDSFDSEQQDIIKKNEHAELIKQYLNEWTKDLNNLGVPDIMLRYHGSILSYLDKEALFYDSFLQGEAGLVESYQREVNEAYENSEEELESVRSGLRDSAQKLGIEPPF